MLDRPLCVLLVDDDRKLLDLHSAALVRNGYRCITATSGVIALDRMTTDGIDVVVSDLSMPQMSGLEFIRHVRQRDPDLPILVATGNPGFDSALQSIDAGVFRYLTKPLSLAELVRAVSDAAHSRALALARRAAHAHLASARDTIATADILLRALDGAWLAVQPIVSASKRRVIAYEALLRTKDPVLRDPLRVLSAAERLDMLSALGATVRKRAAEVLPTVPAQALLFLNLHPRDLLDEQLYAASAPLCAHANRVVLEITERSSLESIPDARARIEELKERGFRVALDDMGAGYAGLTSFAMMKPSYVKVDLSLVRNVDSDPVKQRLIRTIVDLARDLEINVIAEGIETTAERETLVNLGCDLLQGYLFARPGLPFPTVSW
jgi:EAL domain-containing protein (putative c-di-GMP-specific phosphodiesterase class I)